MSRKRHKPEEIVSKLRQVDVLVSQGQSVADAIRSIGVTEVTYYRWRQEFGGLKSDQVRRMKELETENQRLRGDDSRSQPAWHPRSSRRRLGRGAGAPDPAAARDTDGCIAAASTSESAGPIGHCCAPRRFPSRGALHS